MVARFVKGISLSQGHCALQILSNTGYLDCKMRTNPMDPNVKISWVEGELLEDPSRHKRLIGKFSLGQICPCLNQFLAKPRVPHLQVTYHVLQCIKGTVGQGLFFGSSSIAVLKGFADSDWASCLYSRKSISGLRIFIGDSLLSWKYKKQHTGS